MFFKTVIMPVGRGKRTEAVHSQNLHTEVTHALQKRKEKTMEGVVTADVIRKRSLVVMNACFLLTNSEGKDLCTKERAYALTRSLDLRI